MKVRAIDLRIRLCLLFAAAIALLVGGCSKNDDGYTWKQTGPAASSITWQHAPGVDERTKRARVDQLCDRFLTRPEYEQRRLGCAFYDFAGGPCVIYSRHSEDEAQRVIVNGMSHYAHERKHCLGFDHVEPHPRTVSWRPPDQPTPAVLHAPPNPAESGVFLFRGRFRWV